MIEDTEVREILHAAARNASLPSAMPQQMRRKVTLRRARTVGATFLAVVAIAVGGFQSMRASILDDAAPDQTAGNPEHVWQDTPNLSDHAISNVAPETPPPDVPYVIDLTTREMTPLPEAIVESMAPWEIVPQVGFFRFAASRDGSSLAFVGEGDDGTPQIFLADIDGSGVRQLTHDPSAAASPAWSPDGTKIAYVGYGNGEVENVFVVEVATGRFAQITNEEKYGALLPHFTPDGASLLYTAGRGCCGSNHVLRTVSLSGGKSTILFGDGRNGIGHAGGASLSPDGSLVTMMGHEVGGPGALRFVANVDGTELRIVSGRESTPAGTWSPDGTRIACAERDMRDATQSGGLLVVDVSTGEASRVAKGRDAIWLDDHSLLVDV